MDFIRIIGVIVLILSLVSGGNELWKHNPGTATWCFMTATWAAIAIGRS